MPPAAVLDLRTVRVLDDAVEDVLSLPNGLAWTQDGEVWRYAFDDPKPERIAKFCDPHSLTTNGNEIGWLGCETNAVYDLMTDQLRSLPPVGPPPQAKALAFAGDTLVAANHTGLLWKYVDGTPEKLYMHVPGTWTWKSGGLAGGGGFLFAAALDGPQQERLGRVVLLPRPNLTELDLGRAKSQSGWAANERGDVLFVDARGGAVWVVPHADDKARRALQQKSVEAACWCDSDICTLAASTVTRHTRRARIEIEVPQIDQAASYSCGFGRLVVEHDRNMVSSFALPLRKELDPPKTTPSTPRPR